MAFTSTPRLPRLWTGHANPGRAAATDEIASSTATEAAMSETTPERGGRRRRLAGGVWEFMAADATSRRIAVGRPKRWVSSHRRVPSGPPPLPEDLVALSRLDHGPELLDGPLDDHVTLGGNLRDLGRVNRFMGGTRLSRTALDALVGRSADAGAPVTLLDVGTGAADIPRALLADWQQRGRRLEITAVDDRPEILDAAVALDPKLRATPRLTLAVADGRALPWPDDAFDVVHCSLLLHHLDEPAAVAVLCEMARVARRGIVVNDLVRGRLFWVGAWLLAHVATRNRFTRHDAPLSVRRAWSAQELRALLAVAGLRPVSESVDLLRHRRAFAAVRA